MRRQQAGPDVGRSQLAPQQVQSQAALAHTREAHCPSPDVPRTVSGSTFDPRVMLRGLAERAARACATDGAAIRRALGHPFASSNFRAAEPFSEDRIAVAGREARLVNDLRESRQQHTVVSEILSAMSRSSGDSGL